MVNCIECRILGIQKQACFGENGTKIAKYCRPHALAGYVDVKNKTCKHENCTTLPIFGKQGSKLREYCVDHKPEGYVDVKN